MPLKNGIQEIFAQPSLFDLAVTTRINSRVQKTRLNLSDIGAGPGFMVKIFVICISTFTEPPQKLGCCKY